MKPKIAEIKIKDQSGVLFADYTVELHDIEITADTVCVGTTKDGFMEQRLGNRYIEISGRIGMDYESNKTLNRKVLIL